MIRRSGERNKIMTKVAIKVLDTNTAKAYDALTTISSKVRYLASIKMTTGDISRTMTEREGRLVRYQWVRNVLLTPLKKTA